MLRVLLFVLLAGLGALRASDKIDAPSEGASKPVTQPHVTAELIPEMTTVETGKPFGMILHLHMDAGWHTYWINPGDAGIPTTIKWTLPPGFTAGPIQWPTPEKHSMGPLTVYGYDGDVYLLTTITPPSTGDLPEHFDVKAKAEWLVCQEECIPGKAELTVTLDTGMLNFRLPTENTELFKEARGRLPVPLAATCTVTAAYATAPAFPGTPSAKEGILITFKFPAAPQPASSDSVPAATLAPPPPVLRFYPEQPNVMSNLAADNLPAIISKDSYTIPIGLQQNGDKPAKLSGVLVSNYSPTGEAKAVYIAEFPVTSGAGVAGANAPISGAQNAAPSAGANATEPGAGPAPATQGAAPTSGGPDNSLSGSRSDSGATGSGAGASGSTGSLPVRLPSQTNPDNKLSGPTNVDATSLIAVLGAAFIGGLILNLMPCVLPVLSLKVFSLIKHAGEHPEKAWRQGAAFTAGVVVSFWALAGLLLTLRAAGNHLGWGFQMQSPGFVAALIVLFFLIGLNLFGVFEIGTSLVGVDAKAASHAGGGVSSFLNGALATLAATPCTAPFMGSALGFAAQQPAIISLLIFTFLALGMAAPYLLLTIFPQTLRFVPKPGAWMESLKQFMGFLLMGTVIFLVYVFGELTVYENLPWVLNVLLLLGIAAWVYGRWCNPSRALTARLAGGTIALLLFAGALAFAAVLVDVTPTVGLPHPNDPGVASDGWQPWTPEAVQAAVAKGQPVFVDFTAAWCLSCKVNERVALETDAVKKAFAGKNVALFRADWTHADPRISQTLQQYHRDGVPLYLLYSPNAPDAPQVLPEVLTPGIVLDALAKI